MSAVQIVTVNEDETFHLHTERMKGILNREDVKDKQVMVLSVIGEYNHGKSFLLDFFIRYLQYKGSEDWLQTNTNEELTGFRWRTGTVRGTQGIWMWSEPFLVTDKDNKEIAVLLLDTQGAYDSNASSTVTNRIYALTALMSSVTIVNLYFNLKPTFLHELQLIIEYGKIALKKQIETPFQKLLFLVRDWQLSNSCGYEAGQNHLDNVYFKSEIDEVKESAGALLSSFQQLNCFLMTFPGDNVGKPNFKGQISLLKEEFLQQINELISPILNKSNIEAKTQVITNSEGKRDFLTAQEFLLHFDAYLTVLHSNDMPKLLSFIDIAEKLRDDGIINSYITSYVTKITRVWKSEINIDNILSFENPPNIRLQHNFLVGYHTTLFIMNESSRYSTYLLELVNTIADKKNLEPSIHLRALTELPNKLENVFNEEVIPAYHKNWHEHKAGIRVPLVRKIVRVVKGIFNLSE